MKLTSTVAVLALCASAAIAQPKPPATQPAFSISNTRVQTLAAQTYLYIETETTLADMKPVIEKQMTALMKLDEQKKIEGAGPVVFV